VRAASCPRAVTSIERLFEARKNACLSGTKRGLFR
jgi:hypothetical protein